jgi:DNA-binding protein HU-beta
LEAVDAFTEAITGALKKGDKVTLIGFGTFDVVKRAAREGVNPQTRQKIKIKACKAPKFKAGKAFKAVVNK